jgi:hypothetical protein
MFSIRIGRILKFFGLLGSGSVTICIDPDLTPTPDRDLSINNKKLKKNLDFTSFVSS